MKATNNKPMKKFLIVASFELKQRSGSYGCERLTSSYDGCNAKDAMKRVNKHIRNIYGGYGSIKNISILEVKELNSNN